jgi:hypothetical protein
MAKEVPLRQAGGSVGATLPKDMADRLRLDPQGAFSFGVVRSEQNPTVRFHRQDAVTSFAARAAKKYRNALRELAK